jgi:hypothetical protein
MSEAGQEVDCPFACTKINKESLKLNSLSLFMHVMLTTKSFKQSLLLMKHEGFELFFEMLLVFSLSCLLFPLFSSWISS